MTRDATLPNAPSVNRHWSTAGMLAAILLCPPLGLWSLWTKCDWPLPVRVLVGVPTLATCVFWVAYTGHYFWVRA